MHNSQLIYTDACAYQHLSNDHQAHEILRRINVYLFYLLDISSNLFYCILKYFPRPLKFQADLISEGKVSILIDICRRPFRFSVLSNILQWGMRLGRRSCSISSCVYSSHGVFTDHSEIATLDSSSTSPPQCLLFDKRDVSVCGNLCADCGTQ